MCGPAHGGSRLRDVGQDLVARSDHVEAAAIQDGNAVGMDQKRRTMGDDDDGGAAFLERLDRPPQRLLADGIQIGVGLIENGASGMSLNT
jgi:hypothetical protein